MEMMYDIPRFYTALAQWSACLLIILLLKRRLYGFRLWVVSGLALIIQVLFLILTKDVTIAFWWIFCMVVAVGLMFIYLWLCCDLSIWDGVYYTAKSFLLAELMASLGWQIYLFFWPRDNAFFLVRLAVMAGIFLGVLVLSYPLDKKYLAPEARTHVDVREALAVSIIAASVFAISNLSFITTNTPFSGLYESEVMIIRTLVDLGGLAILYAYYIQRKELRVRRELQAMQDILQNQYLQFQQSRENFEIFNQKYHDFKHQLSVIRLEADPEKRNAYLDEIERDIKLHEAQNKTGNEVIDIILTSKSLYCAQKQISLTSVVDGKLLGFVETMDLCSLFGNALDNAIECVEKIRDEEKRLIHLSVSEKKDFVLFRVENYCEEEMEFQDGLPVTTKTDKALHGFGMKSMRMISEKYGGSMTVSYNHHWFELMILIPLPADK